MVRKNILEAFFTLGERSLHIYDDVLPGEDLAGAIISYYGPSWWPHGARAELQANAAVQIPFACIAGHCAPGLRPTKEIQSLRVAPVWVEECFVLLIEQPSLPTHPRGYERHLHTGHNGHP